ncbi:hypothetical protein F511_35479 [Dorcoceras hygrometricum]|uniref:UBN2 domain-containing protein n=1 Tax=Dorcoceras hygrometricum TaxID=472368 RepID=A0A2Z7AD57_9LAMI|nr:hypothetical protein F511_35479 [Dorcoceras hygrometricum]
MPRSGFYVQRSKSRPDLVTLDRAGWSSQLLVRSSVLQSLSIVVLFGLAGFRSECSGPLVVVIVAQKAKHDFDERFSSVVIELTRLGKEYSNRDLALKVMRALPKEWDVKTMTMRESKDLNKLELHDLFANLKAYEFELETRAEEGPSTSQPTQTLAVTEEKPQKIAECKQSQATYCYAAEFSFLKISFFIITFFTNYTQNTYI